MPALAAAGSVQPTYGSSVAPGAVGTHNPTLPALSIHTIALKPTTVVTDGSTQTLLTGTGPHATMTILAISPELPSSLLVAALHTEMNIVIRHLRNWQESGEHTKEDQKATKPKAMPLAKEVESARKAALALVGDQLSSEASSKTHCTDSLYNLALCILGDLNDTMGFLKQENGSPGMLAKKRMDMHRLTAHLLHHVQENELNGFLTQVGTNSAADGASRGTVLSSSTTVPRHGATAVDADSVAAPSGTGVSSAAAESIPASSPSGSSSSNATGASAAGPPALSSSATSGPAAKTTKNSGSSSAQPTTKNRKTDAKDSKTADAAKSTTV